MSHVEKLKKQMAEWVLSYDKGWKTLVLGGLNGKTMGVFYALFIPRVPHVGLPGGQQHFCCALWPEGFFLFRGNQIGKMTTKNNTQTEKEPDAGPG